MSEPLQRWRMAVEDEYGHLLREPFAVVRVQPIADREYGTWIRASDVERLEQERDAANEDFAEARLELHKAEAELAEARRQIDSLTKRLAVSGDPLKVFT